MLVGKYKVTWSHGNNGQNQKGWTKCFVEELVDDSKYVSISMGFSYCSKKDTYNKALGRKLSFKDCVSKLPSKELRTLLWEALKETSPKTVALRKHG